jgi:hypothetical protein
MTQTLFFCMTIISGMSLFSHGCGNPISQLSFSLRLFDVPEGNHSISLYVTMWHYSKVEKLYSGIANYLQYTDLTMANSTVCLFFSVDTAPPKITFLSPDNITYTSDTVTITAAVDEPLSKCTYSLDGQENRTTTGNITLTNLPNGQHNVTVYATDAAGNQAAPQTTLFNVNVPEPPLFPAWLVASGVGAAAAVAALCVFLYYRKRRMIRI